MLQQVDTSGPQLAEVERLKAICDSQNSDLMLLKGHVSDLDTTVDCSPGNSESKDVVMTLHATVEELAGKLVLEINAGQVKECELQKLHSILAALEAQLMDAWNAGHRQEGRVEEAWHTCHLQEDILGTHVKELENKLKIANQKIAGMESAAVLCEANLSAAHKTQYSLEGEVSSLQAVAIELEDEMQRGEGGAQQQLKERIDQLQSEKQLLEKQLKKCLPAVTASSAQSVAL